MAAPRVSVGRITEPYRLSLQRGVVLADFPSTDNDYSEDLAGGRDVMHTRTAWAFVAQVYLQESRNRQFIGPR